MKKCSLLPFLLCAFIALHSYSEIIDKIENIQEFTFEIQQNVEGYWQESMKRKQGRERELDKIWREQRETQRKINDEYQIHIPSIRQRQTRVGENWQLSPHERRLIKQFWLDYRFGSYQDRVYTEFDSFNSPSKKDGIKHQCVTCLEEGAELFGHKCSPKSSVIAIASLVCKRCLLKIKTGCPSCRKGGRLIVAPYF